MVCNIRLTPLAAMIVLSISQPALAHRAPTPLALWGGYDTAGAFCQRIIGRAAARCGSTVWAARTACLATQAEGGTCDQALTDAAVQQAHQSALDLVDRYCADEAVALGFTLTLEAETDIDTFCQQLDSAVTSCVYGRVVGGAVAQPVGGSAGTCVLATADAASHLLRVGFRARTRALDRIASIVLTPSEKIRIVERSTATIEHARLVLLARLEQVCPTDQFLAVYGRTADEMLTLIAQRADCLGGAAYVQGAVLCPAAICGNTMVEPGEQCDDGNTLSGDGCSDSCQIEGMQ